jgi:CubicO group peptidase (beta-lactamase class C family)
MRRLRGCHGGLLLLVVGTTLLTACTSSSVSLSANPPTRMATGASRTSVKIETSVDASLPSAIEAWRGQLDNRKNVRAVIVSQDGRTVFEKYYGTTPGAARNMFSVTKSVISTLIGAAIARGEIRSVNQTLGQLLPSYLAKMTPAVAAVTLDQLLTMTAGVPDWTEQTPPDARKGTDWVADILASITPTRPSKFVYSNPDAHLLSAILTEATHRSVLAFAREVLFDPLGIDSSSAIEPLLVLSNYDAYKAAAFAWPVDPQHVNLGYSMLTLRPRDMLKIGDLYLNDGRWKGQQLLPTSWVTDATTAQVKTYSSWESYGYLWWVTTADGEPAYAAVGAGGQLIEVIPNRRVVVVATSEYDAVDHSYSVEDPFDLTLLVNDVIAPAMGP